MGLGMSNVNPPDGLQFNEYKQLQNENLRGRKEFLQTIASIFFFSVAIALLAILAYVVASTAGSADEGERFPATLLALYALLTVAAVASFAAALTSFDASNPSAPEVVPPHDRKDFFDKLKEQDAEAASSAYFRLRSLRGVSGFFQKMEIVGLPLATIILTILFALLAIAVTNGAREQFLDAMKLTLGALIGSFVQRSVDRKTEAKPRQ